MQKIVTTCDLMMQPFTGKLRLLPMKGNDLEWDVKQQATNQSCLVVCMQVLYFSIFSIIGKIL